MSAWFRNRWARSVLILLVALILLFFGLQAWLSSGIGRGVVESRMSAALGRPVRLDGEFRIGILPVPGANGSGLKLYSPDGRWLVADAGSYLARLSLWPLLKGEVEVVALGLANAEIDLARLASGSPSAAEAGVPYFRLPAIRSFELADVNLYFNGMKSQPFVHIEELSVDDFQVDVPAPLEAGITLVSDASEQAGVTIDGSLTLLSEGVVELSLSRLDGAVDGWGARDLKADLVADLGRSDLDLRVWSEAELRAFSLAARVGWSRMFAGNQGGQVIDNLEFSSGESRVSGTGCLLDGSPPVLHLALQSPVLDIDALKTRLEGFQLPGNDAAEAEPPDEPADLRLPFGLALLLDVDQATYGGMVAEGIRLTSGDRPQCPEPLPEPGR